jgi:hypothetical protein
MKTNLKMLLFVLLGCVIGYFVCWWMCCRPNGKEDCKKECKSDKKCHDHGNPEYTHHANMWDPNCKSGEDNGILVQRSAMESAMAAYRTKLGTSVSLPGSQGGSISICAVRNLLATIEQQQQSLQYLNFRLGIEPGSTFPIVYLIGGTNENNLVVYKSGSMRFCPTQCTLPVGN